jgi:1-acyl-sn-glycerol-3-phosphate acyltransferase
MAKIVNLICLFLGVVWTVLVSCFCIPAFLLNEKWGHFFMRRWGQGLCVLMDIDITLVDGENLPREGGPSRLIAPNHQSGFDIFVLAALPVDFKWVSKVEVARIPFAGWVLHAMGAYLVRRDRSSHDLNVMGEVEAGLRSGRNALIFPEGTRTRTGEMLPFKKGAFRTAQNSGVPLLPIGISGTFAIAPPGKVPTRGHKVTVRVGPPFPVPPGMDIAVAMEEYRAVLVKLLEPVGATR